MCRTWQVGVNRGIAGSFPGSTPDASNGVMDIPAQSVNDAGHGCETDALAPWIGLDASHGGAPARCHTPQQGLDVPRLHALLRGLGAQARCDPPFQAVNDVRVQGWDQREAGVLLHRIGIAGFILGPGPRRVMSQILLRRSEGAVVPVCGGITRPESRTIRPQ